MNTTEPHGPVIVRQPNRRRRLAAILAVGSLASVGILGATMASFNDSEYAGLNDTDGAGYAAALWNLQISEDGDVWSDTTSPDTPGTPDNLSTDTGAPINLVIPNGTGLIPGDAATDAVTTFKVRNDEVSTQNAQISTFKFLQDPDRTSDPAVVSALRFDVTRDGEPVATNATVAQLVTGFSVDQPILAPEAVVTYTVKATLPDQGGDAVANAALQGLHAYLIADVDGQSTTAAATVAPPAS